MDVEESAQVCRLGKAPSVPNVHFLILAPGGDPPPPLHGMDKDLKDLNIVNIVDLPSPSKAQIL